VNKSVRDSVRRIVGAAEILARNRLRKKDAAVTTVWISILFWPARVKHAIRGNIYSMTHPSAGDNK
jgi:hypothetical protein